MTLDEIIAAERFWLVPVSTILSPRLVTYSERIDKLPMMQPVHTENNNSALDMESLEEMLRKVITIPFHFARVVSWQAFSALFRQLL